MGVTPYPGSIGTILLDPGRHLGGLSSSQVRHWMEAAASNDDVLPQDRKARRTEVSNLHDHSRV